MGKENKKQESGAKKSMEMKKFFHIYFTHPHPDVSMNNLLEKLTEFDIIEEVYIETIGDLGYLARIRFNKFGEPGDAEAFLRKNLDPKYGQVGANYV